MQLPYLHRSRPTLAPLSDADARLARELRRDVEILACDIGPRGYFALKQYALAEDFIASSLVKLGYEVERQEVRSADNSRAANVIAEIRGRSTPDRILVAGAHYDSCQDCPAANDNASGVAGLLHLARTFAGAAFDSTVRLVFFANEEPPHFNFGMMGSQDYAWRCRERKEDIRGMFCLETIGCYSDQPDSQRWPSSAMNLVLPTVGDFICFVGSIGSARFIRQCAVQFEKAGRFPLVAAAVPVSIEEVNWSDHRGFAEARYEGFMITDTAPLRYAHYHQPTDTPDKIDFDSMARVVRGVEEMTRGLLSGEL
jgi:Zn-dependent M28 family amino/carboxypeptidase